MKAIYIFGISLLAIFFLLPGCTGSGDDDDSQSPSDDDSGDDDDSQSPSDDDSGDDDSGIGPKLTGTITYTGILQGSIRILFFNSESEMNDGLNPAFTYDLSGIGAFNIDNPALGTWYVLAYLDVDGRGYQSWKPHGSPANNPIVIENTDVVVEISFSLTRIVSSVSLLTTPRTGITSFWEDGTFDRQLVDFEIDTISAYNPVFFPDGKKIAFIYIVDSQSYIATIDMDDSKAAPLQITQTVGSNLRLCVASDNQTIVYEKEAAAGNLDIWAVREGEDPWPVLATDKNEYSPRCAMANTDVFAMQDIGDNHQAIYEVTLNGATATDIYPSEPKVSIDSFAPDPEGKFVYISMLGYSYDIFKISLADQTATSLKETGADQQEYMVALSPDSSMVAVARREVGMATGGISTISSAGGEYTSVTGDEGTGYFPYFSPDSNWLIFFQLASVREEVTFTMYLKSLLGDQEIILNTPFDVLKCIPSYDWYPSDGNASGSVKLF